MNISPCFMTLTYFKERTSSFEKVSYFVFLGHFVMNKLRMLILNWDIAQMKLYPQGIRSGTVHGHQSLVSYVNSDHLV